MQQGNDVSKRLAWTVATLFAVVVMFLQQRASSAALLYERPLLDAVMILGFLWLGTGVVHYALTPAPVRRANDSFGAALVIVMLVSIAVALIAPALGLAD